MAKITPPHHTFAYESTSHLHKKDKKQHANKIDYLQPAPRPFRGTNHCTKLFRPQTDSTSQMTRIPTEISPVNFKANQFGTRMRGQQMLTLRWE